jgi:hypothetical protein
MARPGKGALIRFDHGFSGAGPASRIAMIISG